jgi:hypothetical protein
LALTILLFASLLALFLLLFVPDREFAVSPASYTIDYARRSFEKHLAGDKAAKLAILGKTVEDTVKFSLFVSAGIGLFGFMITFSKFHWLALIVGVVCFAIGWLISQSAMKNEFKKWQAQVFEELPTLISFAPSFLRVGSVTLRDAISMSVSFLNGPLRDEIWNALDRIKRTGATRDAFDELAERVDHPAMDSICIRLSTAWDASPSPDLFEDLSDQIRDVEEIATAGATATKAGMLALICVLGLLGVMMVIGYPAWLYMVSRITMGFGA